MEDRTEHLIESYFAGSLDKAESQELKAILASNPKAAEEFEWQKRLALQVSKLSLSKSIQNDQWREAVKPPTRKVSMWPYAFSAAAVITLLFAAYYFMPNLVGSSTEQLVAESFEHFPNKMRFKNLGGSEASATPELLEAFAEYDKKNYEMASIKLSAVVAADPGRLDYRFYLGVAQSGTKKYPESIHNLLAVADDTGSIYSTSAHYYLGVAFAAINDLPQAQKHLQLYIDAADGVTYRKQAIRLLKALE